MTRKYWIGWSNTDDDKPEDHECFIVTNSDTLDDAVADVIYTMHDDWDMSQNDD